MRKPAKKKRDKKSDEKRAEGSARASRRTIRSKAKTARAKPSRPASAEGSRGSQGPRGQPRGIALHAPLLVPDVMRLTSQQYAQSVAGKGGSGGSQAMPEPLLKRMTEAPLRLAQ